MDSWQLKLDRAEKHLNDLDREIKRYAESDPYMAVRETYCKRHSNCWRYTLQLRENPDSALSMILGDAIHNMRSAMDHLAVAISDPKHRESAAFPCMFFDPDELPVNNKTRKGFESAIAGMDERAVALIKAFQPYQEPDLDARHRHALRVIAKLDNRDKHRQIVLFSTGLINSGSRTVVRGQVMAQAQPTDGLAVNGTELAHFGDFFTPPLNESEVHVEIRGTPAISVDVGLKHGELQVESLRGALAAIRADVIPALEPFVRE